jgi:hypothetical protein
LDARVEAGGGRASPTKEAGQRNGRLALCGGLPPETDGEDGEDWTIVDAR